MEEFDFEILHRAGSSHGNADAVSRRPCRNKDCFCAYGEGDKPHELCEVGGTVRVIRQNVSLESMILAVCQRPNTEVSHCADSATSTVSVDDVSGSKRVVFETSVQPSEPPNRMEPLFDVDHGDDNGAEVRQPNDRVVAVNQVLIGGHGRLALSGVEVPEADVLVYPSTPRRLEPLVSVDHGEDNGAEARQPNDGVVAVSQVLVGGHGRLALSRVEVPQADVLVYLSTPRRLEPLVSVDRGNDNGVEARQPNDGVVAVSQLLVNGLDKLANNGAERLEKKASEKEKMGQSLPVIGVLHVEMRT